MAWEVTNFAPLSAKARGMRRGGALLQPYWSRSGVPSHGSMRRVSATVLAWAPVDADGDFLVEGAEVVVNVHAGHHPLSIVGGRGECCGECWGEGSDMRWCAQDTQPRYRRGGAVPNVQAAVSAPNL